MRVRVRAQESDAERTEPPQASRAAIVRKRLDKKTSLLVTSLMFGGRREVSGQQGLWSKKERRRSVSAGKWKRDSTGEPAFPLLARRHGNTHTLTHTHTYIHTDQRAKANQEPARDNRKEPFWKRPLHGPHRRRTDTQSHMGSRLGRWRGLPHHSSLLPGQRERRGGGKKGCRNTTPQLEGGKQDGRALRQGCLPALPRAPPSCDLDRGDALSPPTTPGQS